MIIDKIIIVAVGFVCSFLIAFAKKKIIWIPAMIIYFGLLITMVFVY